MTTTDARPIAEPQLTSRHWWNLIGRIHAALRRLDIRDSQRDDITLIIDEYNTVQNSLVLSVPCQVSNPTIIDTILAYSSASAATIKIGDRLIPIPMGLSNLQGMSIIRRMGNTDAASTLTATVAGTLYLELFGREIPRVTE